MITSRCCKRRSKRTGSIFSPVMSAGDNGNIFNISDPDELVIGYVEVTSSTRKGMYLSYEDDLYVPDKIIPCEIYQGLSYGRFGLVSISGFEDLPSMRGLPSGEGHEGAAVLVAERSLLI